jgi:hypothetical protein
MEMEMEKCQAFWDWSRETDKLQFEAEFSKSRSNDRVVSRVIDRMHIDFERFISSTLNWPIERTGASYHDKKTAGAWEVFKFAKVA